MSRAAAIPRHGVVVEGEIVVLPAVAADGAVVIAEPSDISFRLVLYSAATPCVR